MNAAQQNYLNSYADLMTQACAGSPVFPSVMIAQGAIESAYGTSSLAVAHNNFFGIEALGNWQGDVVTLPEAATGNMVTFRSYPDLQTGFQDYINFLTGNSNYAQAMQDTDPISQINDIAAAGYAENPVYAQEVTSVINSLNLTTWDLKKKARPTRFTSLPPQPYC